MSEAINVDSLVRAAQKNNKKDRWFHRNPKKTIALTLLVMVLFIDWVTGVLVIPSDYNAYRAPHPYYHHRLLPNRSDTARWGETSYPMYTNSLGFRDSAPRQVANKSAKKRIVMIGDSFTEGLGLPYSQTFVGLLAKTMEPQNTEIFNAAVVSYSPKLYYLKIKFLLEEQRFSFDRLIVFIDISDIQNEISYRAFTPMPFSTWDVISYHIKRFLKQHSFFYFSLNKLFQSQEELLIAGATQDGIFPCFSETDKQLLLDKAFIDSCARWTIDQNLFKKYGQTGLSLAIANMQKLADLCKQHRIHLTIAVYPWPEQIFYRDLDSIQVKAWQQFAYVNGITLINLFPAFIDNRAARDVYPLYFLQPDVHWNAAGHRLIAQKVLPYLK